MAFKARLECFKRSQYTKKQFKKISQERLKMRVCNIHKQQTRRNGLRKVKHKLIKIGVRNKSENTREGDF